jgi:hypothetical protein
MSTDFAIVLLLSEGYRIDSLSSRANGWDAQLHFETSSGRFVIRFAWGATPAEALMTCRRDIQDEIDQRQVIGWGHKRITGRGLLRELGL